MIKKITQIVIIYAIFSFMPVDTYAQNVGIGPDTNFVPQPSAIFELLTNDKGFLYPRMTMLERDAIVNPADWLFINQTDNTPGLYYYDQANTIWRGLAYSLGLGAGSAWDLFGNAATNPTNSFLGTTDAQPLIIKTNNIEVLRVLPTGQIGIGSFLPTELFEVNNGNIKINNGNLLLKNTGLASEINFYEPFTSGVNYTSFKAVEQNSDIIYTLPALQSIADSNSILVNDGTGALIWSSIVSLDKLTSWTLLGNTAINPLINFLGTNDAQPLIMKTNAIERLRILSDGKIGVGTNTPTELIEVNSGNIKLNDGNFVLTNTGTAGEIQFFEPSASGVNYTSFKAGIQDDYIDYTLPLNQASVDSESFLINDGTGGLSWTTKEYLTETVSWSLLGNTAIDPATNFLGTTDAQPLIMKTNGIERLKITSDGNIELTNTGIATEVRLYEPADTDNYYTSFKAVAQESNLEYTLPPSQSANDSTSTIVNDGTGKLRWITTTEFTGTIRYNVLTYVGSSTFTPDEDDTHILINYSGPCRVTLPTGSNYNGKQYFIKRLKNSDNVTICSNADIDDQTGQSGWKLGNDFSSVMLVYDGNAWYLMASIGTVNQCNGCCN